MATEPQEFDTLDRGMRDVALPSGFLERLQAIALEPDEVTGADLTAAEIAALDAGLLTAGDADFDADFDAAAVIALSSDAHDENSDIELPEAAVVLFQGGYAEFDGARYEEAGYGDHPVNNRQLDRWLRRVRLPAGLIMRLRGLVGESVELPARRAYARPRVGMSAAAALLIAFGLCYFGAAGTYMLTHHNPRQTGDPEFPLRGRLDGPLTSGEDTPADAANIDFGPRMVLMVLGATLPSGVEFEIAPEDLLGSMSARDFLTEREPDEVVLPPAENLVGPGSLGGKPVLGFPPGAELVEEDDRFPEPEVVPWEVVRGIAPPKVSGFDLPFLIRNGAHPMVLVDPRFRADPGLRFCEVPLRSDTFSYDLTRRMLLGDRPEFPDPRDVRVEDFLASLDYGWEAPRSKAADNAALRLYVHGAPSLFRNGGVARTSGKPVAMPAFPGLIQVGVQARDEVEGWRQACRLTILVDRSRSMRRGGRIEMVRQALTEFVGRVGPADRISLVAFDREPSVLLEEAAVADAGAKADVAKAIAALEAGSSTNLAAGFRAAYSLAAGHPRNDRLEHRVMLITDGADVGDAILGELETRLAAAAGRGITLSVVDLGEGSWVSASLLRLAEAGRGRAVRASSAEQIRWALSEALTGRSQLVATKVHLRVEFNPDTVESYRLIGHEVSDLARLEGAPLEVDLRAGQSATAMFEIRPKRTEGPIATVELRWRDAYGAEHKTIQPLVGAEFAPRFEDAAVSLQRAAIAAEAAELLRDSPFVEKGMTLAKVVEAAGRVRRESTGEARFQELVEMLKRASTVENTRPRRR